MKTTLGYPTADTTLIRTTMPWEELEAFLATIPEDSVLDVVEFDDGTEPMVDIRYYIHTN